MKHALGCDKPPHISYRLRNGGWVLMDDWTCHLGGPTHLHVKAGFAYDLASVPRLLTLVPGFARFELGMAGPLVHDALYRTVGQWPHIRPTRTYSRTQTDLLFRRLMRADGVGRVRAWLAWLAVRLGGWLCWHRAV